MKSRWMTFLVLSSLLAANAQGAQEPATPVFRVTASQVTFEFIAVDRKGRPVPDLKKGELEVSEFTREQFSGLAELPLRAHQSLRLPHGKHRLVLVVVDRVSGALGTAVREFSVPRSRA